MLNLRRKMRSSNRISETTRIRRRLFRAQKKKSTEKNVWKGNRTKLVVSDCYLTLWSCAMTAQLVH